MYIAIYNLSMSMNVVGMGSNVQVHSIQVIYGEFEDTVQ